MNDGGYGGQRDF